MKNKLNLLAVSALIFVPVTLLSTSVTGSFPYPDDPSDDVPAGQEILKEIILISEPLDSAEAAQDSTLEALRDQILDKASESYKTVRKLMYDNVSKAELYDAVYQCYLDNLKGLEITAPGSVEWKPCKSRLVDINRLLEEGAFYYSQANDTKKMTTFARAEVDTRLMQEFANENFNSSKAYPLIVYVAASGAYNEGDLERAIEYFKEYLKTGDESKREQIYIFLGQACLNTGNASTGAGALITGADLYPTNIQIQMLAIQSCIDARQLSYLPRLIDRALLIKPDDEKLLTLQAALYQREQQFDRALDIYNRLQQINPQSLNIAKETAICYFNLGVLNYNKAIQQENEKEARKYKRQANDYFDVAIDRLREVIANDPLSIKYLKALAVCYGCVDDIPEFEKINERIMALGDSPVKTGGMPTIMPVDADPTGSANGSRAEMLDIPAYSEFGTEYVNNRLAAWVQKGEYETIAEHRKRVNEQSIKSEYDRLNKEAQDAYLKKYTGQLMLQDLSLDKPYDAENEAYQIESSYGPITVKVPLLNHEAENFKNNWVNVRIRNPKFHIKNDRVQVEAITFVMPGGVTYESQPDLAYTAPEDVKIDIARFVPTAEPPVGTTKSGSEPLITLESDVDKNIPITRKSNENTVALIIANENYGQPLSNVESAYHDGLIFKEYCEKTLGIPQHNIIFTPDATLANMFRSTRHMADIVNSRNGDMDIIVYYSGHGMPDEATKEPYIIPVDGDDREIRSWYSLNDLYKDLAALNANSVSVFIDACFSGTKRDGSIIREARGIAIKPKEVNPVGNMYILTATSDNETAMPYKEKNHGLFTYFLLKKLQDSKGNVTLNDLANYVIDNVKAESLRVNHKPQTPTVTSNGVDLQKKLIQ